jgi:hypothetical protein
MSPRPIEARVSNVRFWHKADIRSISTVLMSPSDPSGHALRKFAVMHKG